MRACAQTQAAQALKRKKQANLMTADLSEVLTEGERILEVEAIVLEVMAVYVHLRRHAITHTHTHTHTLQLRVVGSQSWRYMTTSRRLSPT
jgi:hypothetical protein